jgi:hypothetical protein
MESKLLEGILSRDGWPLSEEERDVVDLHFKQHTIQPKPELPSVLLKVREAEGDGFARFHGKDIQALFDAGCLVILTNGHKFHVHSEDWRWVVDAWDFLNGIEPRP